VTAGTPLSGTFKGGQINHLSRFREGVRQEKPFFGERGCSSRLDVFAGTVRFQLASGNKVRLRVPEAKGESRNFGVNAICWGCALIHKCLIVRHHTGNQPACVSNSFFGNRGGPSTSGKLPRIRIWRPGFDGRDDGRDEGMLWCSRDAMRLLAMCRWGVY
jgi:hypothetical protein